MYTRYVLSYNNKAGFCCHVCHVFSDWLDVTKTCSSFTLRKYTSFANDLVCSMLPRHVKCQLNTNKANECLTNHQDKVNSLQPSEYLLPYNTFRVVMKRGWRHVVLIASMRLHVRRLFTTVKEDLTDVNDNMRKTADKSMIIWELILANNILSWQPRWYQLHNSSKP